MSNALRTSRQFQVTKKMIEELPSDKAKMLYDYLRNPPPWIHVAHDYDTSSVVIWVSDVHLLEMRELLEDKCKLIEASE